MNAQIEFSTETTIERAEHFWTPERQLLFAILRRAMFDYTGSDDSLRDEAAAWIFGELEDPSFDEFSFPWLCDQLNMDYNSAATVISRLPRDSYFALSGGRYLKKAS